MPSVAAQTAAALTGYGVCHEIGRPREVRLSKVFHPTASAPAPDLVAREVCEVFEHHIAVDTNCYATATARVVVLTGEHRISSKGDRVLEVHLLATTGQSAAREKYTGMKE